MAGQLFVVPEPAVNRTRNGDLQARHMLRQLRIDPIGKLRMHKQLLRRAIKGCVQNLTRRRECVDRHTNGAGDGTGYENLHQFT